jgi:hypothetical protein
MNALSLAMAIANLEAGMSSRRKSRLGLARARTRGQKSSKRRENFWICWAIPISRGAP